MADDDNKTPDDMSGLGLGGFIKKDANGNATESLSAENGNAMDNPPPTDGTDAHPSEEPAASIKKGSGSAFSMPIGRPADEPEKSGPEQSFPPESGKKSDKKFFFAGDELQIGLVFILKATFKTFFKKFWVFMGVALLNILLVGGVMFAMVPLMFMLMMSGDRTFVMIIPFLMPVLLGLVSFFFFGTIANQAHSAYNDLGIKARQSFRQTVRLTGRAIVLALRIFVYSGLWLIVALMLLMAVLTTVMMGMGTSLMGNFDFNPTEIWDSFQSAEVVETAYAADNYLIAQGGLIENAPSRILVQAESGPSQRNIIMAFAGFVIPVLMLIIFIIAMYRLVYTSLAFPILMASPEHSAKEVLNRSREITKKKWWLIVCFMTIFPLIIALPGVVLNVLNAFVFRGDSTFSLVSAIIGALLVLLAYPLTVTFYQILAQELANPERRLKLHIGLLLLTILIFLSPVLLTVGSVYLMSNLMNGGNPIMDSFTNRYQPTNIEEVDFSLTDSSKIDFSGANKSASDDEITETPTRPKVKRI